MQKDFDQWNKNKKEIHEQPGTTFYHEREVWWCALGVNVGDEQDGTGKNFDRPVVVIKGFNRNIFPCVALTGKKRVGKYYLYLGKFAERDSSAVLSQIKLIDSKRLIRKMGVLNENKFKELKNALKQAIFD